MEEIMEQYGSALLQMAGGAGMFALISQVCRQGGILYEALMTYMQGICG